MGLIGTDSSTPHSGGEAARTPPKGPFWVQLAPFGISPRFLSPPLDFPNFFFVKLFGRFRGIPPKIPPIWQAPDAPSKRTTKKCTIKTDSFQQIWCGLWGQQLLAGVVPQGTSEKRSKEYVLMVLFFVVRRFDGVSGACRPKPKSSVCLGFKGDTELFGPHPLMWKTPQPSRRYPNQKVWVWVPFSCQCEKALFTTWISEMARKWETGGTLFLEHFRFQGGIRTR